MLALVRYSVIFITLKLYGPFLWMGFNFLKTRTTLRRQFTFYHKFPEIPGTHFIDLGRMNCWVDLGATQWFWRRDFDTFYKCSSNINVLSNVISKCSCDDAWETLLKRKGAMTDFFSFQEKSYFLSLLVRIRLKFIFHWKAHCFIQARSFLSSEVVINGAVHVAQIFYFFCHCC